jgi:hypothetical protein
MHPPHASILRNVGEWRDKKCRFSFTSKLQENTSNCIQNPTPHADAHLLFLSRPSFPAAMSGWWSISMVDRGGRRLGRQPRKTFSSWVGRMVDAFFLFASDNAPPA